jgi:hypothetical protein
MDLTHGFSLVQVFRPETLISSEFFRKRMKRAREPPKWLWVFYIIAAFLLLFALRFGRLVRVHFAIYLYQK